MDNSQNPTLLSQPDPKPLLTPPTPELSLIDRFNIKKTKLLSAYYGHPIEDLKLILIIGKHRDLTAQILQGALTTLGQKSSLFTLKTIPSISSVHKFFSDSWKKGSNFVIIPSPLLPLTKHTFYGIPIKILSVTSEFPAKNLPDLTNFCQTNSAFKHKNHPETMHINLWCDATDSKNRTTSPEISQNTLLTTTGFDHKNDIFLKNLKSYKHGTEATIHCNYEPFKIATFSTSENIAESLVSVTAALFSLDFTKDQIIDAIADWDTNVDSQKSQKQ